MLRLLLALLLCLPLAAAAQSGSLSFGFEYRPQVAKVVQGSTDTLRLAFAGGLNTPQFSPIDLNADGQPDLYAFDRQTGRSYTFLNVADKNSARAWQYAPDYEAFFPDDLVSWVLLRDYDCDGRPDLFTSTSGGDIRAFRNVPDAAGRPRFELASGQLRYDTKGPSGLVNLITGSYNLPAIQDVNGDGKLDILTFEWSSSTLLELYLNTSATCGGLDYAISSNFWGQLSACGCTTYARPGVSCRPEAAPTQTAHTSGHSALLLDIDGNGGLDLIAGRDNCDQLATLLNLSKSTVNPSFGVASASDLLAGVSVPVFPAAYSFDANFDGRPDLVIAPAMLENDEDLVSLRASVRLLENAAPAGSALRLSPVARPFLQGDMLDVSEQAAPALADIDGDGLTDMLVGNQADRVAPGPAGYRASLHYYRNVGTARRPVFRLETDDYLGLAALDRTGLRPAFVDLNGDGALDLVYGATNSAATSHQFYFRLNAAPAGQLMQFGTSAEGALRAATDSPATLPTLASDTFSFFDVDNDGFVDLLVGTNEPDYNTPASAGSLRYFRNRGTGAVESRFELADADFAQVRTASNERPTNLAPVVADFDSDGRPDLLTADGNGDIHFFSDLRAQRAAGAFTGRTQLFFNAQTAQLEGARLGSGYKVRPAVAAADLNADGRPELLIGTETGGLLTYGTRSQGLASRPAAATLNFSLFPNPASAEVTLALPRAARVEVLDLTGRQVRGASQLAAGRQSLALNDLAAGVYLVRATAADGSTATRRLAVE